MVQIIIGLTSSDQNQSLALPKYAFMMLTQVSFQVGLAKGPTLYLTLLITGSVGKTLVPLRRREADCCSCCVAGRQERAICPLLHT